MLADLLGFGGRIGRLRFLFYSIALVAFMGAALAAVILSAPHGAPGSPDIPWGALLFCLLVILPATLWASFALQAKRIRDIGWRPLPVIGGYLAATFLDKLVAHAVPRLALHDGGTAFGLAVNLLMAGVLLFWPGNDESDFTPVTFGSSWRPPEPPAQAVVRRPEPQPAAPVGFGRRGL